MREEEESSDVGALWEQALNKYHADSGVNIKNLPQMTWNVSQIMDDQERQVKEFTSWRHNKGLVDKLRSAIGRNSDIIQSVAQQLANAASASFPPSAAIMTAFTYVMKASQNISEDYDLIVGFFDLMNSFLERVSLLESKLPTAKDYKKILMRVFSSLLILCGIASREIKNGRFKKWCKALVKGNDDDLKSSYGELQTNIQRLESATMFATLATTIETKADVKDVLTLTKQQLKLHVESLAINTETNSITKDNSMALKDLRKDVVRLLHQRNREEGSQNDAGTQRSMTGKKDQGAKKSLALNNVKTAFANSAEPVMQFREIENLIVKDTFGWLDGEENYKFFLDGVEPFLWIYGSPGMGKSCLAYSIIERLRTSFGTDPRTTVAYFFFREEHEELRSVKNMLSSVVIEMARVDGRYRDEAASELRKGSDFEDDDGSQIWARFFASKYPKDSEAKLLLVLDGVDEADAEGQAKLIDLLQQIRKETLNIQVVLSGRPDIESSIKILEPVTVEITKAKIAQKSGDLWKIVMDRCKNYSKLKRLKSPVWKKIAVRLRQKADTILFVEHMLRRLNGLGRESLIVKELDNLPSNLGEMNSLMLSECQKHRSDEQLAVLKKLFAWLAYSKRPLTLGEATNLVGLVPQSKSLILEEEIDGRSSRILQLATTNAVDEDSTNDDSDSELIEKQEDNEHASDDFDESKGLPLKFQDRSLRQYFREMEVDETGLRSTPSAAHLIIFEMSAHILDTVAEDNQGGDDEAYIPRLQSYAARFWLQHFLDIEPKNTSDKDAKLAIESLYRILKPDGHALRSIEIFSYGTRDLFGGATDLRDGFFNSLKPWLERANGLSSVALTSEALRWIQDTAISPKQTMLQLARCHISNWFAVDRSDHAQISFQFAENALRFTDVIPGHSQEPSVDPTTEQDILKVANAFEDIPKTSNAERAIGMAMRRFDLFDAAFVQLAKSVEKSTTDLERFNALFTTAWYELGYVKFEGFTGDKEAEVKKAYKAINDCLDIRPCVEADSKASKDIEMRSLIQAAIVSRATCEVLLGNLDAAMKSMEEARDTIKDGEIGPEIIEELTAALETKKEYGKILSVIEKSTRFDVSCWLGWEGTDVQNDRFQRAAKECDNQAFMIQIYEKVLADLDEYRHGSRVRLQLAKAYRNVFPNLSKAKRLLKEVVEGSKWGSYEAAEHQIFAARLDLTEVLTEEFRATSDPKEKLMIFNELKRIVLQDRVAQAADFNPYESQTAIPISLMARKVGPLSELQDGLEKTFTACVEALKDDVGWNDSGAFRQLAKVLACVPGLERDAQISISLQFSVVDQSLYQNEEHSGEEVKSEGEHDGQKAQTTSEEISNGTLATDKVASLAKEEGATLETPNATKTEIAVSEIKSEEANTEVVTSAPDPDEDILSDFGPYCNGCSRIFPNWSTGSIYLCVICTDCDLCEDDYKKRVACNNGEEWKEWKTFCGPNHRYIRGPIAGWKGVKDGVIRIGDEETPFKEWLRGLSEERWKEAWKEFWRRDEGVVDIL